MARIGKRHRGDNPEDEDENLDMADPTFRKKLHYVIMENVQPLVSDRSVGQPPGIHGKDLHHHHHDKDTKEDDDDDDEDDDSYFGNVFESNSHGRSKKRDQASLFTSMRWQREEDAKRCYYHETPEALLLRNNEAEFREVSSSEINKHWGMTNSHKLLNIISNLLLQQIKGGRFRFVYKYGRISEAREKAMSIVWSNFVVEFCKCQWELGFVAVIWMPDPYLYGVPVVLNLTKYRVLVNTSGTNTHMWLYQRRPPESSGMDADLGQHGFMPNVMTFVDDGFVPDRAGRIRSKVSLCLQAFEESDMRKNLRRLQEAKAVFKHVFMTSKTASKDDFMANDDLFSDRVERSAQLINQLNSKLADVRNHLGPYASEISPLAPQRKGVIPNHPALSLLVDETKQIASSLEGPRHNLRPESQPIWEPDPYIPVGIEEEEGRAMSYTAKIFGVPQASVNPLATVQEWVAELRDQNTHDIQRALKQRMQDILESIHHVIYDEVRIKKYVEDRMKKGDKGGRASRSGEAKDPIKDMIFSTDVSIVLPSLPVKAYVKELYGIGILTVEGYREYLHTNQSIEYKYLNKVPLPPPMEYQPPPPEPTVVSKPKPKPEAKAANTNPLKSAVKERPNGTVKGSTTTTIEDDVYRDTAYPFGIRCDLHHSITHGGDPCPECRKAKREVNK